VVQLLYRYLFVISEQAQHMRLAARSRGSASGARWRRWRFRAAAGALAVLFARSYRRADGTYKAMLSRSFHGRLHLLAAPKPAWGDALFVVLGVVAPVGLRAVLVLAK
jgi:energy-coupling factor transporter transmembrane protein EcfT